MQRTSLYAWIMAGCFLLLAEGAFAQLIRPSRSFFLRPSFGFVNYLGDNNNNLLELGVKGQLEAGYHFFPFLGVSALYNYGEYTDVLRPSINTGLDRATSNTRLSTAQLLVRYTVGRPTWELAPYVHGGAGIAFGGDHPDDEAAVGPVFGAGLDILVSPVMSFFFEASYQFVLDDEAIDGPNRGLFADHDVLGRYSLGLSFNLGRRSFVPVEIYDIETPASLQVDQVGTFVARGNMGQASDPVTYRWEFGDGTFSPLLRASHSFSSPGTYTVTFQADNNESSDIETRTVVVMPRASAPEIVAMNSNPANPDTRTEVAFDATVLGSEPLTYIWRFDDGETFPEAFPLRTFEAPGPYTVELTVSNQFGTDTQRMSLNVDRFEATFCEEVREMNAVFFSRQSSQLSAAAVRKLEDNLQILLECPNLNIRVEGFAVPGERDADGLSADRARAVEQYYVDQGMSSTRILSLGRGVVQQIGQLKDGSDQFRRVETILLNL